MAFLYGMWACAFGALVVSFLNYFHRCMNLKVSGVVGAIFGTIISCALTPVETYHADGVILAAINGLVGGLLANGLMFAQSDFKFERLAHEVTKVIGFAYSFTALSGGLFLLVMLVAYSDFISYLVASFPCIVHGRLSDAFHIRNDRHVYLRILMGSVEQEQ